MYKTQSFKKKILVTAVASVAMSGFMAPAFAQEEDTEVVITGIRASVINAMNTKRDAVGVVDAISTEDIGKMPDANLAESLQRIPGVSINRSNGEGARVTVRGIDPALNMVTLNNRNMPAVSTADPGDTASRAYDFSNLASEVVSGVELYKTGKANVTSGGLGATINVRTVRPLDIGDTKAVVSAKAVHDTTVDKGSEITPELSGLYSWANDEGTFGVAISGAYQERDSMRANAFVTDYNAFTTTSGVYASGATLVNAPTNGSLYLLPTDLRYQLDDNSRTRENGMLTMQFRPIEDFTATVDYVSTNNDLTSSRAQQSTWFEPNRFTYVEFGGGAIASPTVLVSDFTANPTAGLTARAGKDFSFAKQSVLSETHSDSFGVNLDWQVNDQLSFTADFHDSYATNNASRLEAGLNANITAGYYTDYSYELPVMGIVYDDSPANAGNNSGAVDGGDISGSIGSIGVSWQRTDIKQLQLGGEFEFNEDMKLAFGADLRKDENASMFGSNDNNRMTMGNWGGVDPDSLGENWTSYFTPRNFGDGFQDYGSTTGHNFFFTEGLDADLDAVMDRVEGLFAQANTRTLNNNGTPGNADDDYWVTPTGVRDNNINPSNFNSLPNGKFAWRGNVDVNRVIEEEVNAAFVQFSGSFDFGSVPVNVVAGLRYESTDVTSTSAVREVLTLEWQEDNDWASILSPEAAAPYSETASYNNTLPSLDVDVSPTEDIKLRASFSKTIGRAGYSELRADKAIVSPFLKTATGGNPGLKPMESVNIDLSGEWYYNDQSYASIGYFRKDISNFIGIQGQTGPVYGLRDVRAGAQYQQAVNSLPVNQQNDLAAIHSAMLVLQGKNPADPSTSVYATDADPIMQWNLSMPINNQDTVIDGVELAVQHWFGESGFGVQANYTAVNADDEYDITQDTTQFAMIGLSDSANLIGFYDRDGLQVRIGYNWRDEFLSLIERGGQREPEFTEAFGQIDLSISYDILDNVTVSFEGVNVTGENYRRHARQDYQLWDLEDLGARYNAGIRYTF